MKLLRPTGKSLDPSLSHVYYHVFYCSSNSAIDRDLDRPFPALLVDRLLVDLRRQVVDQLDRQLYWLLCMQLRAVGSGRPV